MTAKDLFSKDATVEYRVVPTLDGNAQWHWVLFNVMGKVLAGNTAVSRGKASAQARAKARQLHRHISKVRVTGLVEEGRPVDIKKFIAKFSKWIDVADRLGYKPTVDQFWAKAANGEPIYARKIEGNDYDFTISIFGGIGNAKSGGQLVWVAVDFQDVNNRNRIALHNFLTTDKNLPHITAMIEEVIYSNCPSWGEVDRILGEMRRKNPGVMEAEEQVTSVPQPTNPAKEYIMGTSTWQEQLKVMGAKGPEVYMPAHDPQMKDTAKYEWSWSFGDEYITLDLLINFTGDGKTPRIVMLRGEYMSTRNGTLTTKWHNNEQLDVAGDMGMKEFLDVLEPAVEQVNVLAKSNAEPATHWEFAKLISRVQSWMTNQPQMAGYI